jgi:hypothetical protein
MAISNRKGRLPKWSAPGIDVRLINGQKTKDYKNCNGLVTNSMNFTLLAMVL